jgi:Uma2 family endonuclease
VAGRIAVAHHSSLVTRHWYNTTRHIEAGLRYPDDHQTHLKNLLLQPEPGGIRMTIAPSATTENIPIADGPPQGQWTVADWEHLVATRTTMNGYRYEVIDGVITMTTAPSFFHQWIITRLIQKIGTTVEKLKLGFWMIAPIGVVIPPRVAAQPDFLVILNQNRDIIRGGRIRGAPDLVVEVLSPGNSTEEMERKRWSYEQIGVTEYAVVDPSLRTLTYYRLEASGAYGDGRVFAAEETVTFACVPDMALRVAELFEGAPDTTLEVE